MTNLIDVLKRKKMLLGSSSELRPLIPNKVDYFAKMYLLLSLICNLRCSYCTIRHNVKNAKNVLLTEREMANSLELFFSDLEHERPKEITLYGGEPLKNPVVMRRFFDLISPYQKSNNLKITIITNGTLFTEEWVEIFRKHNVFVIVSVDGTEEIHNKYRVDENGKGSFSRVMEGFELMRNSGLKKGISLVITPHNINKLKEIVHFFKENLSIDSVGFTIGHLEPLDIGYFDDTFVKRIIDALDYCAEIQLWNEQLMKKVKFLIDGKTRFFGCPVSEGGCMIRILPGGDISLCENFGLRNLCILGNVNNNLSKSDVVGHRYLVEWYSRYFTNNGECRRCKSISICGGGCPYDAWLKNRDMMSVEERNCLICNGIVDWYVQKLYEKSVQLFDPKQDVYWCPPKDVRCSVIPARDL
ncbi:MAG: radical SAM protein [Candidatus Aminicenantes bacterium]|nr:MAG: radical SAM protein [Candidatus Aminicenantes bacterium]